MSHACLIDTLAYMVVGAQEQQTATCGMRNRGLPISMAPKSP